MSDNQVMQRGRRITDLQRLLQRRSLGVVAMVVCFAISFTAEAIAQKPLGQAPRTGDEVWLIDTHQMECARSIEEGLQVSQWHHDRWVRLSIAQLLDRINGDRNIANMFFVHGNRTSLFWGVSRGEFIYQQLLKQPEFVGRVRFIIWAWPSEKETGPIRDFKVKAKRADHEGSYFGWVLSRCRPEHPLGLIGYSFGSRVVMGGLSMVAQNGLVSVPTPADHHPLDQFDASELAPRNAIFPFSSRFISHRIDGFRLGVIERRIEDGDPSVEIPLRNELTQAPLTNELSRYVSSRRLIEKNAEEQLAADSVEPIVRFQSPDMQFVSKRETGNESATIQTDSKFMPEELAPPTLFDESPDGYSAFAHSQGKSHSINNRVPVYRVALIAAACDQGWFNSPCHYQPAYNLADKVLLVFNSDDRALKYFGFIARGGFPKALGSIGVPCKNLLPDLGQKLDQLDVAQWVGKKHSIDLYLGAPVVIEHTCDLLLGL